MNNKGHIAFDGDLRVVRIIAYCFSADHFTYWSTGDDIRSSILRRYPTFKVVGIIDGITHTDGIADLPVCASRILYGGGTNSKGIRIVRKIGYGMVFENSGIVINDLTAFHICIFQIIRKQARDGGTNVSDRQQRSGCIIGRTRHPAPEIAVFDFTGAGIVEHRSIHR